MTENNTRTVVTVYPSPEYGGGPTSFDNADGFEVTAEGILFVTSTTYLAQSGGAVGVAAWARDTWHHAEITKEVPDFELSQGEPAGEFVPDEEMAEQIARRHYDAIAPFEVSRDEDGPNSLANKLIAAALDGLRA